MAVHIREALFSISLPLSSSVKFKLGDTQPSESSLSQKRWSRVIRIQTQWIWLRKGHYGTHSYTGHRDWGLTGSISELPPSSCGSMSSDFWNLYLNHVKSHSASGLGKILKLYPHVSAQRCEFTWVLCSARKAFLLGSPSPCFLNSNATFPSEPHSSLLTLRHHLSLSLFSCVSPWIYLNSRSVVKRKVSGPTDLIQIFARSLTFLVTLGKLNFSKCQFLVLHEQKGCHNAWQWFLIWEP